MIKKIVLCATALAFMFSIAVIASTSHAMDPGPAVMDLKTAEGKKPVPNFQHKKHQDMFKCDECHHTKGPDGKQAPLGDNPPAKCESCHNQENFPDPKSKLNSFKGVAHENCKGCHKEMAKEGKNAPTKCNDCHTKK